MGGMAAAAAVPSLSFAQAKTKAVKDAVLTRIAFGSCCHQDKPQPIWANVNRFAPDLFIFLGDNIYGDTEDMAIMQAKYAKLALSPDFRTCDERLT